MSMFEQVVQHFGNKARLAEAIGVTRQAVNSWKNDGFIPAGSAVEIERITDGKFRAIDLVEG